MMTRVPHGFWVFVWQLDKSGGLDAVIARCKQLGIDGIFLKAGDGEQIWDGRPPANRNQFSMLIVKRLHDAGIKVIGWSYNYGYAHEDEVAKFVLSCGADGYCFDAEIEYEQLPNPAATATAVCQSIRATYPNASLGYNPFPIIEDHQRFPYVELGRYCDYVMPQVYQRALGNRSPASALMWTLENFRWWEASWRANGHGDSIKPLVIDWQGWNCPASDIVEAAVDSRGQFPSIAYWVWQDIVSWPALQQAVDIFKGVPAVVDIAGLGSGFADYAVAHNLQGPHTAEIHVDTGSGPWSFAAWEGTADGAPQVVLTYAAGQGVKDTNAGWALYHLAKLIDGALPASAVAAIRADADDIIKKAGG